MSTLSNKRRKVSHSREYECSEPSDDVNQDNNSKPEDQQEQESKSDRQSSTISQDNRESSRATGLVRRRK